MPVPGLSHLCPTESGYVEQLFQFLQATAQEDGFFGESQAARWHPGGRGLLVVAALYWAVTAPLQEGGLE